MKLSKLTVLIGDTFDNTKVLHYVANKTKNCFFATTERGSSYLFGLDVYHMGYKRGRERILVQMNGGMDEYESEYGARSGYNDYIAENIIFSRESDRYQGIESFITKDHPEIIEQFELMLGGTFIYETISNSWSYRRFKSNTTEIDAEMGAMACCEMPPDILNLLMIFIYLKHKVKKQDTFIIEYPELYLQPSKQRMMGRIIAMVVNAGVRVLITTHSDYIIEELNHLTGGNESLIIK